MKHVGHQRGPPGRGGRLGTAVARPGRGQRLRSGPRRGPGGWAGGARSGPGTERPVRAWVSLRAEDRETRPGRSYGSDGGVRWAWPWSEYGGCGGRAGVVSSSGERSPDSNFCVSFPGLGGVHPHILTCGDAENKRTR